MERRSSFPMQTVPGGRRQALLHKRSVPPQGLHRRPRFRQPIFQPAMIYHAIDEAYRFGHDPSPLLCLHVPDSPNERRHK